MWDNVFLPHIKQTTGVESVSEIYVFKEISCIRKSVIAKYSIFYKHRSIPEIKDMFLSSGYVIWHWKKCLCYAFDNLIKWNIDIKILTT